MMSTREPLFLDRRGQGKTEVPDLGRLPDVRQAVCSGFSGLKMVMNAREPVRRPRNVSNTVTVPEVNMKT